MVEHIQILNIHIASLSTDELLRKFREGLLVTPNIDHLVMLQRDKDFYEAYKQADWIICDSQVLYFLSSILSRPFHKAIAGSSFFHDYYLYHRDDNNCRIFILGGKSGVAELARSRINQQVGRNMVVGAYSPSFHIDDTESRYIAQIINHSDANVVMVGLGAPKQEKWIVRYRHLMPCIKTWMALGATVDFEAGTEQRAPKVFRTIGMEWFWRMMHNPIRLIPRYMRDIKFFGYFAQQIAGKYRNPFGDLVV